jgi:hypothetical protein
VWSGRSNSDSCQRKRWLLRTTRAAEWLLAEYDATDIDELTDSIGAVQIRPICTLKSLLNGGVPMRVTAADYQDPDRRCL